MDDPAFSRDTAECDDVVEVVEADMANVSKKALSR